MTQKQNIDRTFANLRTPNLAANPDRRRSRFLADTFHAGGSIELGALPVDIQRTVQARIKSQTGRNHAIQNVRLLTASSTTGTTWQEADRKAQRSFTVRFFLAISPALIVIAALIVLG